MMQVHFYSTFRLKAGFKTLELDLLPGVTLRYAIEHILKRVPVLRPDWLDEKGELQSYLHIFVNGQDSASLPDGIETVLGGEDILDFFPPVAGG